MVNTDQILENFVEKSDKFLRTSNKSFTLKEHKLYSYDELISFFDNSTIVVINKTAKGKAFYSMTTSTHVNKLINYLMENEIVFTLINKDKYDEIQKTISNY